MTRFYFGAYICCLASFFIGMRFTSRTLRNRELRIRALIAQLQSLRAELLQHTNTKTGRNPLLQVRLSDYEQDDM